jgi:hypothetical protein
MGSEPPVTLAADGLYKASLDFYPILPRSVRFILESCARVVQS